MKEFSKYFNTSESVEATNESFNDAKVIFFFWTKDDGRTWRYSGEFTSKEEEAWKEREDICKSSPRAMCTPLITGEM